MFDKCKLHTLQETAAGVSFAPAATLTPVTSVLMNALGLSMSQKQPMTDAEFLYARSRGRIAALGVAQVAFIAAIVFSITAIKFGLNWTDLDWGPAWKAIFWVHLVGLSVTGILALAYFGLLRSDHLTERLKLMPRLIKSANDWLETLCFYGFVFLVIGAITLLYALAVDWFRAPP